MNETAKSLLKGLQNDLDNIKLLSSNIEVIWQLEQLKNTIDVTKRIIRESI